MVGALVSRTREAQHPKTTPRLEISAPPTPPVADGRVERLARDDTPASRDDSLTDVAVPPLASPIEHLRKFKEAGKDRFVGEEIQAAVTDQLDRLLQLLRTPLDEGSRISAAAIFAADFTSTPLAPESERAVFNGPIYRAFEGAPAKGSRAVTPTAFAEEVAALLGGARRVVRAELKSVSVSVPNAPDDPIVTQVLVRLGGEDPDSQRRWQWNGRWELT